MFYRPLRIPKMRIYLYEFLNNSKVRFVIRKMFMYFIIKFFQKISAINRPCSYNIHIFKTIIYAFSGSFF